MFINERLSDEENGIEKRMRNITKENQLSWLGEKKTKKNKQTFDNLVVLPEQKEKLVDSIDPWNRNEKKLFVRQTNDTYTLKSVSFDKITLLFINKRLMADVSMSYVSDWTCQLNQQVKYFLQSFDVNKWTFVNNPTQKVSTVMLLSRWARISTRELETEKKRRIHEMICLIRRHKQKRKWSFASSRWHHSSDDLTSFWATRSICLCRLSVNVNRFGFIRPWSSSINDKALMPVLVVDRNRWLSNLEDRHFIQ